MFQPPQKVFSGGNQSTSLTIELAHEQLFPIQAPQLSKQNSGGNLCQYTLFSSWAILLNLGWFFPGVYHTQAVVRLIPDQYQLKKRVVRKGGGKWRVAHFQDITREGLPRSFWHYASWLLDRRLFQWRRSMTH
jgi:hypothetical protein